MNRPLNLFTAVILAITPLIGDAQSAQFSPLTAQFTIEDGLPSNQLFDVEFDNEGTMWIASENGVVIFNGHQFVPFNIPNTSSVVLKIEKDTEGKLWFLTVVGELIRLNTDSKSIEKIIKIGERWPHLLQELTNFHVLDDQIVFNVLQGQARVKIKTEELVFDSAQFNRAYINPKIPLHFVAHTPNSPTTNLPVFIGNKPNIDSVFIHSDRLIKRRVNLIEDAQGCKYIQFKNNILKVNRKGNSLVRHFEDYQTPSITLLANGELWVGNESNGMIRLNPKSLEIEAHLLPGVDVTSIAIDENENYWVTTLSRGLYRIENNGVVQILHSFDGPLVSSYTNDSVIMLGDETGILKTYQLKNEKLIRAEQRELGRSIRSINNREDTIIVRTGTQYLKLINNKIQDDLTNTLRFKLRGIISSSKGTRAFRKGKVVYVDGPDFNPYKIRKSFDFADAGIYFGNFSNILYLDRSSTTYAYLQPLHDYDLRCAAPWNGDTVLLGTKGAGLFLVANGKVLQNIQYSGYDLSTVLEISLLNGSYWCLTNNDFLELKFNKYSLEEVNSWKTVINQKSLNIDVLTTFRNKILLGNGSKLLLVDPQKFKATVQPGKISMVKWIEEGQFKEDHREFTLDHNHKTLRFTPVFSQYNNLLEQQFRYRIMELDTLWSYTSQLPISINTMPSGEKHIQFQMQNVLGEWSESHTLQFDVMLPVYLRWWFIVLLMSFITITILVLNQWRVRRILARNRLENEVIAAQNKALSLQLNPHFIFNSLNSVIATILNQESQKAVIFLTQFARMMRNTFDSSNDTLVPLNDELKRVADYLKLEQQRAAAQFEFEIIVSKKVDQAEVQIPPLILQPILENSVWHGIGKINEGKGEVKLEVSVLKDSNIVFSISDNGPGSVEEMPRNEKNSRLSSTVLLKERLRLLSKAYRQSFELTYINNNPTGIVVRLSMPLILQPHDKLHTS